MSIVKTIENTERYNEGYERNARANFVGETGSSMMSKSELMEVRIRLSRERAKKLVADGEMRYQTWMTAMKIQLVKM